MQLKQQVLLLAIDEKTFPQNKKTVKNVKHVTKIKKRL